MPINVLMPALSPTMEEGTLARWLIQEGDVVRPGTVIAEIETDKATMEFEAIDEGVVGKIVVPEGTNHVRVNDLIAVLLEEGEEAGTADAAPGSAPSATAPSVTGSSDVFPPFRATSPSSRVFASPLARRVAAEMGLGLGAIAGSGPNGRIVRADVDRLVLQRSNSSFVPKATHEIPVAGRSMPVAAISDGVKKLYADREYVEIELDGMRRTIASRISEAKRSIPHFYLRRDVCLDPLLALRAEMNAQLASRNVKLSVNDFVIKACALALQGVPECNAVWAGDRILRLKASDVAVAVAIDGGLFTPIVRDADKKTLSTLSDEMKDLASRARDRKLAPHEYQGGSFSISNLGMMGVESFDAVINPPQASILAVGAGVARPVVGPNGSIDVATMMSLTLSVDHRVIDGALGASFLLTIKENLENPLVMLA